MDKLTKILIIVGVSLVLVSGLLIISTSKISCIETHFDCLCGTEGNGHTCALCDADYAGIKAESCYHDCEWFPFLCGYEDVKEGGYFFFNPIICGFGLCTWGFVDSDPSIGATLPNSTDLPIYVEERELEVGTDIIIIDERFELIDKNGYRTTYSTFNELIESEHLQDIKDKFFGLTSDKTGSFYIDYYVTIESNYEFDLTTTLTVERGYIDKYDTDFVGKTKKEIKKGTNQINVSLKCEEVEFFLAGDFGLFDNTEYYVRYSGTIYQYRKEE